MLASSTTDALGAFLPIVLLIGFWIFLTRRVRESGFGQEALLQKLDEIRDEIRRLRKSIEERSDLR